MTIAVLALQGAFLEHEQMLKKLGADYVDTQYLYHCADFNHAVVWFAFRPFFCGASLSPKGLKPNDFSNKEELDIIKADLDKALEFMEYLKEFNAEMEAM